MVDSVSSYFKRNRTATHDSKPYQERQFSFKETPIFHSKSQKLGSTRFQHLPHIPCINPPIDFEDEDGGYGVHGGKCETRHVGKGVEEDGGREREMGVDGLEVEVGWNEEEIDSKAEEFITRFYDQMKLQRQLSNLQHTEMLHNP